MLLTTSLGRRPPNEHAQRSPLSCLPSPLTTISISSMRKCVSGDDRDVLKRTFLVRLEGEGTRWTTTLDQ